MTALRWLGSHEGRYALGTWLFERASPAGGRLALRDVSLRYLQELYAVTQEPINLAVLDGPETFHLEKLVRRRPVTQQATRAAPDRPLPGRRDVPASLNQPAQRGKGRLT